MNEKSVDWLTEIAVCEFMDINPPIKVSQLMRSHCNVNETSDQRV